MILGFVVVIWAVCSVLCMHGKLGKLKILRVQKVLCKSWHEMCSPAAWPQIRSKILIYATKLIQPIRLTGFTITEIKQTQYLWDWYLHPCTQFFAAKAAHKSHIGLFSQPKKIPTWKMNFYVKKCLLLSWRLDTSGLLSLSVATFPVTIITHCQEH